MAILLSILLAASTWAQVGGSILLDDVRPILSQRRVLTGRLLEPLELSEEGEATRIGSSVIPALAGTRIGPYVFPAKMEGVKSAYNLEVVVNTEAFFFDKKGALVGKWEDGQFEGSWNDLKRAVTVKENFLGLAIRLMK